MSFNEFPGDDAAVDVEPRERTPAKTNTEMRSSIAKVESTLTEFEKVSAGLDELHRQFPIDLVYDVATGKGMVEAVAHRAAWREPRLAVERLRKQAKAPVLKLGKDIDARAAWLTEQLLLGERPIDEQIKAEEARKERIKQERIIAEFGRVTAIQEAIAEIGMAVMSANGKTSAQIAAILEATRAEIPGEAVFQEMLPQAQQAQASAISKLEMAHKAALHTEAEAARLAAERAELEQLRKEAAERKARDEAAAREQAERVAAEQKAQAELLAQQRAEIEREAAKLAEQKRAAEAAEAQRLKDEQDREDARRRALDLEAQASMVPATIQMQPAAAPEGDLLPVPDVIEGPVESDSSFEPPPPPMVDDGREWKLGEISLAFGVTLTAAFVADLGVLPARTDKAAKLFSTSQVLDIRARLVAHLMSLKIEYSA